MKKLIKKLNFAIIGIMASAPAMAAANINEAICKLAAEFKPIFSAFRTLAFIGAGLTIATWAWGWISKGDFDKEKVAKNGFGMLIGFVVLFALGGIITAFMSMAGPGGQLGCGDLGTAFFG